MSAAIAIRATELSTESAVPRRSAPRGPHTHREVFSQTLAPLTAPAFARFRRSERGGPPTKPTCVPGSAGCVPNWMPCEDAAAKKLPFCDHTKPTADRVANLISLMTQDELCGQTYDLMHPIAKVPSWKGYNWNTECLHGLGAICATVNGVTRCPSVFPAPPAMVRPPTAPAWSFSSRTPA